MTAHEVFCPTGAAILAAAKTAPGQNTPPPVTTKMRRRQKHRVRGRRSAIIKRIDGSNIRFALIRKTGLSVRRGRRRPERIVSFRELLDLAEGQSLLSL